jgi:hypothetical protein
LFQEEIFKNNQTNINLYESTSPSKKDVCEMQDGPPRPPLAHYLREPEAQAEAIGRDQTLITFY